MIWPLLASTKRLQIARPSPIPWALVVKRGVNILDKTSSDMPLPVSWKRNSMKSPVFLLDISISPPFGMASIAFFIRFMKTL